MFIGVTATRAGIAYDMKLHTGIKVDSGVGPSLVISPTGERLDNPMLATKESLRRTPWSEGKFTPKQLPRASIVAYQVQEC